MDRVFCRPSEAGGSESTGEVFRSSSEAVAAVFRRLGVTDDLADGHTLPRCFRGHFRFAGGRTAESMNDCGTTVGSQNAVQLRGNGWLCRGSVPGPRSAVGLRLKVLGHECFPRQVPIGIMYSDVVVSAQT